MISGIYAILNIKTEKCYIGSAISINRRWSIHKSYLNLNKHPNNYLQNAWNKYTDLNFIFTVLEFCEKEKLIEREQCWIDSLQCLIPNGYNIAPTAGSQLGFKHSEETKQKYHFKKQSEKSNLKRSIALTGRIFTNEHKQKIGNKNRKIEKWPCKDGSSCKCKLCKYKRQEKDKLRYKSLTREQKLERSRKARKNIIGSKLK